MTQYDEPDTPDEGDAGDLAPDVDEDSPSELELDDDAPPTPAGDEPERGDEPPEEAT